MDVKEVYDVVVLGAGVEGSATAYNLVKSRAGRVLLLEQFSALHTRGSSHGGSRITRKAYSDDFYIPIMNEAFKMWSQIEEESKTKLYLQTGILLFGPRNSAELNKTIRSLVKHSIEHEVLSAEEAMLRWPQQLALPHDHRAVFERDGGILLANTAVQTIQRLFVEFGGELSDNQKVTELGGDSEMVRVVTHTGAVYHTRKLVVTPGAWAPSIMAQLGVQLPFKFEVRRAEVYYWKADNPEVFSADKFPVFGMYDATHHPFYGLPIHEYPGLVKICAHVSVSLDPDARDKEPPVASPVAEFVGKYFKGVATTPSIYEACIVTKTPDENPIIDRHPDYPNIVFAVGFSGHGFKLAPAVGKMVTEIVMDQAPSFDVSPFKLNRFSHSAKL